MEAMNWPIGAIKLSARWFCRFEIGALKLSARIFRGFNIVGCLLFVLLVLVVVLPQVWPAAPALLADLQLTCCWLILALLVGFIGLLFWPAFPPWYSHGFRYLIWWIALAVGTLRRHSMATAALACALLGVLYTRLQVPSFLKGTDLGKGLPLSKLLALLALATVLYGAYRARKNLVIVSFSDFTGDPTQKVFVAGLAFRLRAQLATISEMYSDGDEAWSSDLNERIALIPQVQDLGTLLQGVVTADTKISLGFLQFPLGAMLGAFSRLVQGPRLTGSVHHSAVGPVVIVEIVGGGVTASWTIGPEDLTATEPDADELRQQFVWRPQAFNLDELPEQLAYGLLTHLTPIGSKNWRAVKYFSRGLSAYREARASDRDWQPKLLRAERYFLRALDEDKTFVRSHYNLGVVYSNLGKLESAEASFHRAMQEGHGTAEACLALANVYYSTRRYDESVRFYEDARRSRPTSALAWQLVGVAYRRRREQEVGDVPHQDPVWKTAIECREIAAALSWRDLCAATAAGRREHRREEVVVNCFRSLAANDRAPLSRRERSLRQVLHLFPKNYLTQVDLARVLFEKGDYEEAIALFNTTAEDLLGPEDHVRQRLRAMAADLHLDDHSRAASYHYFHLLDESVQESRATIFIDWRNAACPLPAASIVASSWFRRYLRPRADRAAVGWPPGMSSYIDRLLAADRFLQALRPHALDRDKLVVLRRNLLGLERRESEDLDTHIGRLIASGRSLAAEPLTGYLQHLEGLTSMLRPRDEDKVAMRQRLRGVVVEAGQDWNWALAQLQIVLASSAGSDGIDSLPLLDNAIDRLSAHHQGQIRSQGLHRVLGQRYLQCARDEPSRNREHLEKALYHAERAVAIAPAGASERRLLAEICEQLHDYERAEAELNVSIGLEPNNPRTVLALAGIYWARGRELPTQELRREAFMRVRSCYLHALTLIASEPLDPEELDAQVADRAETHFSLGNLSFDLMMYDQAISHFSAALSSGFKPIEANLNLGSCCFEAKAYDQAEAAFIEALRESGVQHHKVRTSLKPAEAAGEDVPINSLLVRLYVRWAMLLASLGVNLDRADKLAKRAKRRLARVLPEQSGSADAAADARQLRAALHECNGAILFARGQYSLAVVEIQRAQVFARESSSYLLLARCYIQGAQAARKGSARKRDQARDACVRARETDIRGLYGAEIAALLDDLKPVSSGGSGSGGSGAEGQRAAWRSV
jgi:tetratricopeptide (TPR) repeat protein